MFLHKSQQQSIIESLPLLDLRKLANDNYECRCISPDCKKDLKRKGGFFWSYEKQIYVYSCFRCKTTYNLEQLLRDKYQQFYIETKLQQYGTTGIKTATVEPIAPEFKINDDQLQQFIQQLFEKKQLVKLENSPYLGQTLQYLRKRSIPEDTHSNLYISDQFNKIYYELKKLKGETVRQFDDSDIWLCWFFKNRNNEFTGIQGRNITTTDKNKRYQIFKFGNDPVIGNLENINFNKPVYAVEGYIDSLFLDNCISLQGMNVHIIDYILSFNKLQKINVVFDNEPNNKGIQQNLTLLYKKSMLDKRLSACLLPGWLRDKGKDINEYILAGLSKDELINIIDSNCYSGLMLKAKSVQW